MNIFFQVVPCSSDIIFIDITSNLYRCDTKLIWIITPSATGGLMLGFCWTSCKTQVVLTEAFHQSLLPTYAFYGRGSEWWAPSDNDRWRWYGDFMLLCQISYNKIIIYFCTVFPRSRHRLFVSYVANAVHYRVSPHYLAEKEWSCNLLELTCTWSGLRAWQF